MGEASSQRRELMRTIVRRVFLAQLVMLGTVLLITIAGYFITEQLGSVFFTILVGFVGGSLALLRRLRREPDAVLGEIAQSWITTMMPVLYGGLMAGVAYLLFMSGILSGDGGSGLFTSNLFPNFTKPETAEGELLSVRTVLDIRPADVQDFGKLLVWSFIAGYSERFVADILRTLERNETPAAKS